MMIKPSSLLRLLFLLVNAIAIHIATAAQSNDSLNIQDSLIHDTAQKISPLIKKVQEINEAEKAEGIEKYKRDKHSTRQEEIIEQIIKTTEDAKAYIKIGVDTIGLNRELINIDSWYNIASDGVFTNTGTAQTHRNLETSYKILKELSARITERKLSLDAYYKKLVAFRNKIDSLNSDTILYDFPTDSVTLIHYVKRLAPLALQIAPADSALKKAMLNVEELQIHVNTLNNKLRTSLEQIEAYQQQLSQASFQREFNNIWNPVGYNRPFDTILKFSAEKGLLALVFYTKNHITRTIFLLVLIIFACIFLRSLKKQLLAKGFATEGLTGQLVLKNPISSALIVTLNVFQFIFPEPPFVFSVIFWIISATCLCFIMSGYVTRYWMRVWLTLFALFILTCFDNLVLQASRTERYFMLLLSLVGAISSCIFLMKGKRKDLREKLIVYFIAFLAIVEIAAAFFNAFGRYNLSKTLLTSGFINVIIAISFLWTIRLINEALTLASKIYTHPDSRLFYINFEKVGNKAPSFFYIFMVIGWLILCGRNFYSFRLIESPINNFLSRPRYVGDFTFTVQSMFVFFGILILAAVISKIVSFFASDKHRSSATNDARAGIGSWLLIIRIFIISIGVFLAFAAAGIPMDRITIILGALGVGIGLGLQSLVNNLVSGLVISFEKPFNVGDIVEMNNSYGTVKSIGFRSSVVTTFDGAELIIPNADIITNKLTNWQLGNTPRKATINVGVAYASDIDEVKKLLVDILHADKRILQNPKPVVFINNFSSSSVDFLIWFWVKGFGEMMPARSDIISAIKKAFKENNITIPFPQQDLHIKDLTTAVKNEDIKNNPPE